MIKNLYRIVFNTWPGLQTCRRVTLGLHSVILGSMLGCASYSTGKLDAEQSVNAAKVRVFRPVAIFMYPGKSCYLSGSPGEIKTLSLPFAKKLTVGMPSTEDMPDTYDEFLVPGNSPLTVRMWIRNPGARFQCDPGAVAFTPESGKNYDTALILESGYCHIRIRELVEGSPGKAFPQPLRVMPATRCPD